ncbi:MAG: hypothetical protein JKY81_05700 [Colwellia sp.]|nr:hypothetical protein [Colwellia sp.]
MSELKKVIPTEFYNEDEAMMPPPRVNTVGELIEQLKRLPSDLPLSGWEYLTHEIIVYNITMDNTHVSIEEVDEEF